MGPCAIRFKKENPYPRYKRSNVLIPSNPKRNKIPLVPQVLTTENVFVNMGDLDVSPKRFDQRQMKNVITLNMNGESDSSDDSRSSDESIEEGSWKDISINKEEPSEIVITKKEILSDITSKIKKKGIKFYFSDGATLEVALNHPSHFYKFTDIVETNTRVFDDSTLLRAFDEISKQYKCFQVFDFEEEDDEQFTHILYKLTQLLLLNELDTEKKFFITLENKFIFHERQFVGFKTKTFLFLVFEDASITLKVQIDDKQKVVVKVREERKRAPTIIKIVDEDFKEIEPEKEIVENAFQIKNDFNLALNIFFKLLITAEILIKEKFTLRNLKPENIVFCSLSQSYKISNISFLKSIKQETDHRKGKTIAHPVVGNYFFLSKKCKMSIKKNASFFDVHTYDPFKEDLFSIACCTLEVFFKKRKVYEDEIDRIIADYKYNNENKDNKEFLTLFESLKTLLGGNADILTTKSDQKGKELSCLEIISNIKENLSKNCTDLEEIHFGFATRFNKLQPCSIENKAYLLLILGVYNVEEFLEEELLNQDGNNLILNIYLFYAKLRANKLQEASNHLKDLLEKYEFKSMNENKTTPILKKQLIEARSRSLKDTNPEENLACYSVLFQLIIRCLFEMKIYEDCQKYCESYKIKQKGEDIFTLEEFVMAYKYKINILFLKERYDEILTLCQELLVKARVEENKTLAKKESLAEILIFVANVYEAIYQNAIAESLRSEAFYNIIQIYGDSHPELPLITLKNASINDDDFTDKKMESTEKAVEKLKVYFELYDEILIDAVLIHLKVLKQEGEQKIKIALYYLNKFLGDAEKLLVKHKKNQQLVQLWLIKAHFLEDSENFEECLFMYKKIMKGDIIPIEGEFEIELKKKVQFLIGKQKKFESKKITGKDDLIKINSKINLAELYISQGNLDKAKALLMGIITLIKDDAEMKIWGKLAKIHEEQRNLAKANNFHKDIIKHYLGIEEILHHNVQSSLDSIANNLKQKQMESESSLFFQESKGLTKFLEQKHETTKEEVKEIKDRVNTLLRGVTEDGYVTPKGTDSSKLEIHESGQFEVHESGQLEAHESDLFDNDKFRENTKRKTNLKLKTMMSKEAISDAPPNSENYIMIFKTIKAFLKLSNSNMSQEDANKHTVVDFYPKAESFFPKIPL